ncbi:uncharacterized protein A4U43_C07F22470 [Asparagus officinalis]|uniref:FAD/NAD(P)-binding domain-containing protein n=1 Tax=Asparagus officinalis TaxID=4686 RepID=A0A5P1EE21_ASPOF|nr:uncharacterized protein A4U43_C07F22470 [Asparagus officinalis]
MGNARDRLASKFAAKNAGLWSMDPNQIEEHKGNYANEFIERVRLCDVSAVIQEVMESYEVEINGKVFKKAKKVVVIGGGYIGMEVATATIGWNLDTTEDDDVNSANEGSLPHLRPMGTVVNRHPRHGNRHTRAYGDVLHPSRLQPAGGLMASLCSLVQRFVNRAQQYHKGTVVC